MSPEPPTAGSEKIQLQGGLHQRHLTMIALGGVIGAGLFVGSGAVINQTGPAAVLSYILTGVLIVTVMRMLGEMASAHPTAGSFSSSLRPAAPRSRLWISPLGHSLGQTPPRRRLGNLRAVA